MTQPRRIVDGGERRTGKGALPTPVRAVLWLGVFLPLLLGARDCERVVVGHECDGGRCGNGDGCLYAGERYADGESFPSDDGCNTCTCQDGGVACTERACADGCGGIAGIDCAQGEYCNYPPEAQCGAADQTGTCAVIPDACTLQYDPVCGCDDRTYGNACEAAANGVSVVHDGECEQGGTGGESCGGLTGLACLDGEYCNFPEDALCGAADRPGTCAPIPQVCTRIYAPVCGCDDRTYGNECEAAAAGVSVASTGECDQGGGSGGMGGTSGAGGAGGTGGGTGSGDTCGGLTGLPCPGGEYCNFPDDALCGAADQTGTCELMPQACTLEYDPVCGCDDMTYGNDCAAAAAGVSVAHTGECLPPGGGGTGDACGGLQGLACGAGEFCSFSIDAQCGAADQTGTCEVMPQACTLEYDPVCGCDDMTYGNDCAAHAAGVSVASTGECPP